MDRVIKFRGKDRDGVWYFGNLKLRDDDPSWATVAAWIVDPQTVGEFTGFKDIDGNEIFEGDIIQNDEYPDIVERVHMSEGCWSVGFYPDEANPLAWTLENAPFKVIGNIHDNPELLEGGKADD